jgi:CHAT domain-containing protein
VGLTYIVNASIVWCAVVESREWQWIKLGPMTNFLAPAAALRSELNDPMAVARRRMPQLLDFSAGWGRELIPPALLQEPPDMLVFVPYGPLHALPLHLVSTADGAPMACRSGTVFASSLSSFRISAVRNQLRNRRGKEPRIAAGGIDIQAAGNDNFRELAAEIRQIFQLNHELEFCSREEIKAVLIGSDYDVVCIVAHGFMDRADHRDSGLLVGRFPRFGRGIHMHKAAGVYKGVYEFADVPLREWPAGLSARRPAEILTLADLQREPPIDVELTVLLACSAGASVVLQGDEPASVAEAIVRLGSPSVLAPMWDCDYQLARAWIEAFFGSWNGGSVPKGIAVRDAFRSVSEGRDLTELAPMHLRGDWR